MKRIFIICAVILLPLTGCEKKYCWKCMTTTVITLTSSSGSFAPTTTSKVTNATLCDETDAEIQDVEKPKYTNQQQGANYISTTATTTCSK